MDNRWNEQRVIILGGARQGQAAARWLVRHGAFVTINDMRSMDQMSDARLALADIPVKWVLGSHPVEILKDADVVCLSGGVPLTNPIVLEAKELTIPLTNDTQIFMEAVPCPTIGITGSAGKTTTTSLVGDMAKAAHGDKVYVGGNIGDPLLNHVDEMEADGLAVLEISSFQLEQMSLSPSIAAVLNITPNHLDRHGNMQAYTAAKQRILDFQHGDDTAVLCREDAGSWELLRNIRGRLLSFGFEALPAGQDGSWMEDETLFLSIDGSKQTLMRRDQIQLRGDHNVMNVLAAFAIGKAASLPVECMQAAAKDFHGVAHRLEFVREHAGVKWYNDSIATAPERTMADIRSFSEPIVLLLGGRDKDLPWDELAALCRQRVEHVVLFGEAADKIAHAFGNLEENKMPFSLDRCTNLENAVDKAAKIATPGDVVLLAPGGTSFDEFRDFEERGERFRKWVSDLS